MFDSGLICKEKLHASHSQGSKGYADVTRFRANVGQLCVSMSLCSLANYSIKRIEVLKKRCKDKHVASEFLLKETKHFRLFWYFFWRAKEKLAITLQFFLHEMLLNYCLAGIFKGSLVKFFAEKVARGNSVQTGLDFPAKSLSIYTSNDLLQAMNMEKWIISTNKVVEFQC